MGDAGFRAQPEAISRYGSSVGEQNGQLSQVQSVVSGIVISGGAFGKLPNAHHLSAMYQEHADANRKNLSDLIEALNQTAQGLDQTARNYTEHDQQVSSGLGGGQ